MREQRQRKALYVNRREELYAEPLLRKEYAAAPKRGPKRSARATATSQSRPRAGSR